MYMLCINKNNVYTLYNKLYNCAIIAVSTETQSHYLLLTLVKTDNQYDIIQIRQREKE